jgi:hypothetical protein
MDIRVAEGQFVEVPAADASGMDRRAFGEFVGSQGEMASYALGWTTGHEHREGLISIGIGVGNPGGATFHAVVFNNGGEYAFSLIDDPFEQVPQGGPDLTAEQARAHEDLAFIWWVANHVFARDRRAWWMRHWLLGTRCIQTPEVFELRERVLLVSHDADDKVWQLIGRTDPGDDGKIAHLSHAIDEDQTLLDVLDLPTGDYATRESPSDPWTRHTDTPS